jgi:hypothetical protein
MSAINLTESRRGAEANDDDSKPNLSGRSRQGKCRNPRHPIDVSCAIVMKHKGILERAKTGALKGPPRTMQIARGLRASPAYQQDPIFLR